MKKRPAVFLDLNGTLVLPVKADSLTEYVLIPGSIEAIVVLNAAGFVCPVVTVQSRIAKNVYSEAAFRDWFTGFQMMLREHGAEIVGPYLCPHSISKDCPCGKPKPFLYLAAAQEQDIDLSRSFVVGDTPGDVQAARVLGAAGGCFVRTGWGPKSGDAEEKEAVFVGADILDVARWITRQV